MPLAAVELTGSAQHASSTSRALASLALGIPMEAETWLTERPPAQVREVVVENSAPPVFAPEASPKRAAAIEQIVPAPRPPAHLLRFATDPEIRWFNGRPVRPARQMTMEVTAYSPDWRSCGDSDDGITATLHSVETNGHALVAADPKVLAYGSLLTIPGYDQGRIVPVLDCGGAIKGKRLDVLYSTHARARQWGRRTLKVTVWEYADGKPPDEPRKAR